MYIQFFKKAYLLLIPLIICGGCSVANKDRLINASRDGNLPLIEYYIENGDDINSIGGIGIPPVQASVFGNHIDALKLLLNEGASPDTFDRDKCTAVHLAVNKGYIDLLEVLLGHGANPDLPCFRTPLAEAANQNRKDVMGLLLRYGASVTVKDDAGRTALMSVKNIQTMRLLLDNGAQFTINAQDKDGITALMNCHPVVRNSPSEAVGMVELLLKSGADLNLEDITGSTLLDHALRAAVDHPSSYKDFIVFLKERGAETGTQVWGWQRAK